MTLPFFGFLFSSTILEIIIFIQLILHKYKTISVLLLLRLALHLVRLLDYRLFSAYYIIYSNPRRTTELFWQKRTNRIAHPYARTPVQAEYITTSLDVNQPFGLDSTLDVSVANKIRQVYE